MREDLAPEIWPALAAGRVVERKFLYIIVKDRDTGDPVEQGFWNGEGSILAPVTDAITRLTVYRQFDPMGGIPFELDDIPLTSDVSVRTIEVTLSQIDAAVEAAVRLYDMKFAPVQIYRGLFSPATRNLITPAAPRFVGLVNAAPLLTPAVNGNGSLRLSLVSQSRELTRSNPDVRSDESQQARYAGDRFFQHAEAMKEAVLYWGEAQGTV